MEIKVVKEKGKNKQTSRKNKTKKQAKKVSKI
jgi:hypothetical protein